MNAIIINKILEVNIIGLGCRNEANCPHMEPGPMRGMPSVGVVSSPFLHDFQRKPRKTPKGEVDKRDRD